MDHVIRPFGGALVELIVSQEQAAELKADSLAWPSWDLSPRQLGDLELLLSGALSPLRGYLTRRDHDAVAAGMHLADGTFWPLPLALDVTAEFAAGVRPGDRVALRDPEGVMPAVLVVEDVWEAAVTTAEAGAAAPHTWRLGGAVLGLRLPVHHDAKTLRRTPSEVRAELARCGWRSVVHFATRSPLHRAAFEMTRRALREHEANLLLHGVVGMPSPGDVEHYARVRSLQAAVREYPADTARLALLPLSPHRGDVRDALLLAIVARNFGCSHVLLSPEHGAAAEEAVRRHAPEIGVTLVPFRRLAWVEVEGAWFAEGELSHGAAGEHLDDAEIVRRVEAGHALPPWCTFPAVEEELRRAHPPRHRRGLTVFFTGLSGSGKSTIANAFLARMLERGGRPVTLLDGDVVRKHLSSELGFSREHRNLNIQRIGYVASEITKHGGVAICAPIAPYDAIRREVRAMVEQYGGFVLVHVATPVEVCEQRDRKGLYAKARAGIIREFTGISDPYEAPEDAEVVIDTGAYSPEEAAQKVLLHLEGAGWLV